MKTALINMLLTSSFQSVLQVRDRRFSPYEYNSVRHSDSVSKKYLNSSEVPFNATLW